MRQDETSSSAVLDYAEPTPYSPPRRLWMPITFAVLVWVADALVPRLYRWQWPLPGDYAVMVIAVAGVVVCALLTTAPAWLLGLYGLACAFAFFPNMLEHRQFFLGVSEPKVYKRYLYGWVAGLVIAWLAGRSSVLLRRPRDAA